ncbi:hypothetical protein GCM10011611_56120 [Aliidongia dinghuensis]|uniref:Uncharacterized protein n=1 Tax=Aliidongia dinghuensis TaxID=1867774 RepID=A0A8J3E6B2_9PROT|nr:hypothetical protein [Aliidongia dinghuensis]GGF42457.1 hypothetical protein GCM10011611_56120 [Aliidongia dinghuensis]
MTRASLDAAAQRLNPFLAVIALGLLVVDGLLGLSHEASVPPPAPSLALTGPVTLGPVTLGPATLAPASAVMSAETAAALADMKDRD